MHENNYNIGLALATGKGNTYEIVSKLLPEKQQGRRVLGLLGTIL